VRVGLGDVDSVKGRAEDAVAIYPFVSGFPS
jgi:hypothetical protein